MKTFLYYTKIFLLVVSMALIFMLGVYDLMLKYDNNYLKETAAISVENDDYEYITVKGYDIKIPKCIEHLK